MTEETIDDVKQAYALLFKAHSALVSERDELAARVRELEGEPDAAVRDARRYRWLTSSDRRVTWIWNHALTDEDRGDHLNFDAVCDAALTASKGQP